MNVEALKQEYADKMEKATPEQVQHIIEKFTKKEAEE